MSCELRFAASFQQDPALMVCAFGYKVPIVSARRLGVMDAGTDAVSRVSDGEGWTRAVGQILPEPLRRDRRTLGSVRSPGFHGGPTLR